MIYEESLAPSDFKCDYRGKCRMLPFVEVFYSGQDGWSYWSYLCLFHFIKEYRHINENCGWGLAAWLLRLPLVKRLWNWWAKRC
jgi:hypothetical protein